MQNGKKSNLAGLLKNLLSKFKDVAFPHGYVCLGCGKELGEDGRYDSLCVRCRESLPYRHGPMCPVCGDYVNTPGRCAKCNTDPPSFDKAYAPFEYGGLIRKTIIGYKDNDGEYLREYIVKYLTDYAKAMELTADLVTYVPSLNKTIRLRGFDHMRTVTVELGKNLGIPVADALERKYHRKDQTNLTYNERQVAVKGAFTLADGYPTAELSGKTILLVDDVMTSRATASECSRILKENGADKIIVLTLAR